MARPPEASIDWRICGGQVCCNFIHSGVQSLFYPSVSGPPLFTSPANINLPGDPEKYCILNLEVTHMLVKQAIEPQFILWPFRSV